MKVEPLWVLAPAFALDFSRFISASVVCSGNRQHDASREAGLACDGPLTTRKPLPEVILVLGRPQHNTRAGGLVPLAACSLVGVTAPQWIETFRLLLTR